MALPTKRSWPLTRMILAWPALASRAFAEPVDAPGVEAASVVQSQECLDSTAGASSCLAPDSWSRKRAASAMLQTLTMSSVTADNAGNQSELLQPDAFGAHALILMMASGGEPAFSWVWTRRDVWICIMIIGCVLGLTVACFLPTASESLHQLTPVRHEVRKPIDEDIYGMLVTTLIIDSTTIAREREMGSSIPAARHARVLVSFVFLITVVMFQAFMLLQIVDITDSQAVKEMQEAYNQYETHMYNGHTRLFLPNYVRGIPGHFDGRLFTILSESLQNDICRMPLSRLDLLVAILIIWSFCAVVEFKAALALLRNFVFGLPTLRTMAEGLRQDDGLHGGVLRVSASPSKEDHGPQTIVGATAFVKCAVTTFLVLPRIAMVTALMWLGCRWLTATNDFGDLILDAVALEFVLLMKNLLYSALAPYQSKLEIRRTCVATYRGSEASTVREYIGAFGWAIGVFVWVMLYLLFFQTVLPEYRWDISVVCRWHTGVGGVP